MWNHEFSEIPSSFRLLVIKSRHKCGYNWCIDYSTMSRSVFHKYEKYWKTKNTAKNPSPLDWFDIKCLAQSLLSDEERIQMDSYLFHEQFFAILIEATKSNEFGNLQNMLKTFKMDINFYSMDGYTPLQTVCKLGNNELLQILLQYDANPNLTDIRHGYSCLQLSAQNNHSQCIITLLSKNANLMYINKLTNHRTALHYAAESGYLESIKELINTREYNVIRKKEIEKEIKILLDVQDVLGLTALHLAVIDGKVDCVKLLVEVRNGVVYYFVCICLLVDWFGVAYIAATYCSLHDMHLSRHLVHLFKS